MLISNKTIGRNKDPDDYTLSESYVLVAKALIMRSTSSIPESYSGRVAVFTMMVIGALIFWVWEASLISFVSVRKIDLPIKTLHDLAENSDLKVRYCNTNI